MGIRDERCGKCIDVTGIAAARRDQRGWATERAKVPRYFLIFDR